MRTMKQDRGTRHGENYHLAPSAEKNAEQLKDRRDYRTALIQRRNGLDVKIARVEDEIARLKGGKQ